MTAGIFLSPVDGPGAVKWLLMTEHIICINLVSNTRVFSSIYFMCSRWKYLPSPSSISMMDDDPIRLNPDMGQKKGFLNPTSRVLVFRHLSYCYLTVYIYTYMYVYIYLLNEQVKNHKRLRRMSNIIGKSKSILVYWQSFKKIGPGKKE